MVNSTVGCEDLPIETNLKESEILQEIKKNLTAHWVQRVIVTLHIFH